MTNFINKQLRFQKMNSEKITLKILGSANTNVIEKYTNILNYKENDMQVILFCDYSTYDIPKGYIFNHLMDPLSQNNISCKAKLKDISQEFGIPFDSVPKGYKTICNFKFSGINIPKMIMELPIINDWYESNESLIFS